MEKEMEGIMGSMSSLYIRGSNSLPRRGSQPLYPDPRKTSTLTYKKPEIPRYIPRAKLLEQSYKTEDKSPDIEHKDLLSPSGFNRKVDIKSDLKKMVVTVVNDQAGIVSGQSRRNHPQTLNLQFTEKSDRYYRNEDGFRSPKHRGSIDFSRDDECETPTSPGSRIYRYKFEGIRKGTDMSRDDDCDSVSSQNQRQSKRRSYTKSKHYTSHYRRQRTGSISSEFSAASDASVDDTNGGHTYDWDEEVEREMSKSVHEELREETQKLQQMTEKMENMDYLETGAHPKLSVPSSYRSRAESSGSNYSEQPQQGRSRKRDRRKSSKPKTESRDSSLQSNPSKDQISSHSGDGPRRGKGRGRRRRNNRESAQNSALDADDTWKPGLRVTFGKSDRQVQMKSGIGSNQSNRAMSGNAESPSQEKCTMPRGGGIIHLPQNVSTTPDKDHHQHSHPNQHSDPVPPPLPQKNSQPRPRDQGGGSKKILFDPRNPNKPIVIKNSALKFHDPYEQSHAASEGYPRNLPNFYSEYGYNYPDMVQFRDSPNSTHSDLYYTRYQQPTKESGIVSDENYEQDGYYHK